MSRRYGRFVDMRWIQSRMNTKDARRQRQAGTLFPAFLTPEVVPFVDIEIVPAKPDDRGPVVEIAIVPVSDVPVSDVERTIEETQRVR